MVRAAVIVALVMTSACSNVSPSPKDRLIEEAQRTVARELRDPDSAQFRDMVTYPSANMVCGEVNGNNAYGALAGFSSFVYVNGTTLIDDYSGATKATILERCTKGARSEFSASNVRTKEIIKTLEDGPEKRALQQGVAKLEAEQAQIDGNSAH